MLNLLKQFCRTKEGKMDYREIHAIELGLFIPILLWPFILLSPCVVKGEFGKTVWEELPYIAGGMFVRGLTILVYLKSRGMF